MHHLDAIRPELEVYSRLLEKWQKSINLVSRRELSNLFERHFHDSADLAAFGHLDAIWGDIGSGAGFPGMVVGILQKQCGGQTILIEPNKRKAAFLREVSRETGACVHVLACRAEDVMDNLDLDYVTSRAFTSLSALTNFARRSLQSGSIGVFLKGQYVGLELTDAPKSCNLKLTLHQRPCKGYVVVARRQ